MSAYRKDRTNLETTIVTLLKERNTKAISLLTENYADTLYGMVLRIVKQEVLAEEVLQDVFVKIWKNAEKYDSSKGRLFTWMANIARNTSIDLIRSARFNRESKTNTLDLSVYNNEKWSTELNTEDSGLRKVIASLDKKQIQVIDLVYFQGYTHSEVAKELDIPLGTVKSRIRLAIIELRKKLSDDNLKGILISLLICFINLFI